MKKYSCLVCDDEPVARRIIINFIEQIPFLELAGECENGLEAIAFLQQKTVDLLFLDVNMPILNGMDFLRTIKNLPKTILTTAYSEHALEAFDLEVIDYLVKPIPFDRFIKAVNRATAGQKTIPTEESHLVVKFGRLQNRVRLFDILYIESQANVVKIVAHNNVFRTYQTLSSLESQLPADEFVRTHRSFLVNRKQVTTIEGLSIVFADDLRVPISEPLRLDVLRKLGFGE
jgi:two-component system, LytTR family, response regulator